jgi:prephenate dehydratase
MPGNKVDKVLVLGGNNSQTGIAARQKFPGIVIDWAGSFDELIKQILENNVLGVLPVWNSYEGEITKTKIAHVFNDLAFIHEIWPKRIKFEFVTKTKYGDKEIKEVISVSVAKAQCSKFLSEFPANFKSEDLTTEAKKKFDASDDFDAILSAPEQCNGPDYRLIRDDVTNRNNFTNFVLLGKTKRDDWDFEKLGFLSQIKDKKNILFGMETSIPRTSLTKGQHEYFDNLSNHAKSIDEIPKIIFVVKRDEGKCGVLIEGKLKSEDIESPPEYLDEEGADPDILIKDYFGETSELYTDNLFKLFAAEFQDFSSADFIKLKGANSFFYCCPALNIATHGFDENLVEAVVRKTIAHYFGLIEIDKNCTVTQRAFFDKHRNDFIENGEDFINFTTLAL